MADSYGTIIVYACPECKKTKQLAITNIEDQPWAMNYNEQGIIHNLICGVCTKTYTETKFQIPAGFQDAFRNPNQNGYKCPCCPKITNKPSLLERCIAGHLKPYVCILCEKSQRSCEHGRIDDTAKHLRNFHKESKELIEGIHFRVQEPHEVEAKAMKYLDGKYLDARGEHLRK